MIQRNFFLWGNFCFEFDDYTEKELKSMIYYKDVFSYLKGKILCEFPSVLYSVYIRWYLVRTYCIRVTMCILLVTVQIVIHTIQRETFLELFSQKLLCKKISKFWGILLRFSNKNMSMKIP